MKSLVFTAAVLLLPLRTSPASPAEPWEGAWVYEPQNVEQCAADASGSPIEVFSDVRGIIFTRDSERTSYWQERPGESIETLHGQAGAILAYERGEDFWECSISKVTNVIQLDAWIFDVECGGEGEMWQTRTMVMLTKLPEGMAAYNLGWEGSNPASPSTTQLFRCAPAGN